ncbi:MAG: archease [Planctomycetes bacterium]|nr:archease [Anaerohalosphaera sp.]MCK5565870.1 archease [Planctomycetota bacterium]
MYEHFNHQADIGIKGIGSTIDDAFEQAAIGMMAVICNPRTILPEKEVKIFCTAPDEEFLLVDFLNAIIYEMAVRNMLFGKFEVTVKGDCLEAKAWGEKSDPQKHQTAVEVKGATYTELEVKQESGEWTAQCVIDV